jgi:DNA-directed RNA polymerase subunit RPC12/RpoP
MQYDPYEPMAAYSSKMKYKAKHSYRSVFRDRHNPEDGNFKCHKCGNFVVQSPQLSGVRNRNHCPYCLWSRHVDLRQPGDRLAACKGKMRPIGLAFKKTRKKYESNQAGELMLIHECTECGKISINRIAADDLPDRLEKVLTNSSQLDESIRLQLNLCNIQSLNGDEVASVQMLLAGLGK